MAVSMTNMSNMFVNCSTLNYNIPKSVSTSTKILKKLIIKLKNNEININDLTKTELKEFIKIYFKVFNHINYYNKNSLEFVIYKFMDNILNNTDFLDKNDEAMKIYLKTKLKYC